MSSTLHYSVSLHVVVSSLDDTTVQIVQDQLKTFVPDFSFSPMREQPSLQDCIEFYASADVTQEQRQLLIDSLDNDWDKDEDDDTYWAYGFNTKTFNPLVYYMQLDFQKLHQK
ncbi:hypothetical protein [Allobaculum sp. JKK-2023]|uniref:hypothetical protein n=1 Tax=Allobaculum sp. JKK-2023 TaxID=3108943 RepID=UPI002B05A5CA|nr:hypothetical protein [Allobaculum sp. JKK-2023]